MILYEFEGKQLLSQAGLAVPKSQLLTDPDQSLNLTSPFVLKAQVLSGKRAEAGGIVKITNNLDQRSLRETSNKQIQNLFEKTINGEKVNQVLVEELIEFEKEYYISISYDTDTRSPVINLSSQGGTGIEDRGVKTFTVDLLNLDKSLSEVKTDIPLEVLKKLVNLFLDQDCILLEVNPLVKTSDNNFMALDAKVKLDEGALGRHPEWKYPPRSVPGHNPTDHEIAAKKIDEGDYRGTAGSTYFDLDGDIAVLTSGGGGSLTALDALIKVGGHPADYTEYSGNPPKEKVEKLTKIVLSKPGINGLWVVGAIANLTDIYETLSGFMEGLRNAQTELKTKFDFPIVIRRAGPRDDEAFKMLKEVKDFDLHLYGTEISITESAKIMADLAQKYAQKKGQTDVAA